MDYFTSDLHLQHKEILNFERFNFKTIEEHDKYLFNLLKDKIKPTDTLYVLGDVGRGIEIINEICGRKVLIMGNHDTLPKHVYTSVFDEVYKYPIYYKNNILLSHYPVPVTQNVLNVHGHLHSSVLDLPNYKNANIAINDYQILTARQLEVLSMRLPPINNDFLKEWYAEYYKFIPKYRNSNDVLVDENNRIKIKETLEMWAKGQFSVE